MELQETYAAVGQFVFVEGRSRREAASVFGLSRDTISKMCRFSAPPGYVRSKPPGKPKPGPLIHCHDRPVPVNRLGADDRSDATAVIGL
jgi:hypothetical protein